MLTNRNLWYPFPKNYQRINKAQGKNKDLRHKRALVRCKLLEDRVFKNRDVPLKVKIKLIPDVKISKMLAVFARNNH